MKDEIPKLGEFDPNSTTTASAVGVEKLVRLPSEPTCENCGYKSICSQNVLFALPGGDATIKELTVCSQFERL